MAIGLGPDVRLPLPGELPLAVHRRHVQEFWRRWHISLSTWFRDYLYIPLGGNRVSPARRYRNLVTVFFLCGLWHGASWNFVIWGLLHGIVPRRSNALGAIAHDQRSDPIRGPVRGRSGRTSTRCSS